MLTPARPSRRWASAGARGRSDKQRRALGTFGEMGVLALAFLENRRTRNYSAEGVEGSEKRLRFFLAWCEERSIVRAQDVTRAVLEQYQRALFYRRKANGQPLAAITQHGLLQVVAFFFQYLVRRTTSS